MLQNLDFQSVKVRKQLEQEKQLVAAQAVLDGEIQERIRIARDLHDSLGSILAGTKLNLQEMKKGVMIDSIAEERYNTALGLLDDSVREMRRVAHHLMPDALSRGMGLTNIRNRVAAYNGSLMVDAKTGGGTEINVELKVEN